MKRIMSMVLVAFWPALANAGEDCTCRHQGNDIPEGQTICMKTPSGMQMAKCDRVLNNTSWKMLGTECPNAMLDTYPNQTTADLEHVRSLIENLRS